MSNILHHAKILIVDDEPSNVRFLEIVLQQEGYTNIHSTTDARQALPLYRELRPDVVLLDLHMPHLDGFEVLRQLAPQHSHAPDGHSPDDNVLHSNGSYLPILVLTADITPQAKHRALTEGAKDFLTKPLDDTEVLLRVHNLLQTRFQNLILEEKVQERTRDLEAARRKLEESQSEILDRLARAAEYRDDDTGQHTRRVGEGAAYLAQRLGWPDDKVKLLCRTAPLHDVGKIGIPDAILLKPGKLTPDEFDIIKTHAQVGAALLVGGHSELVQMAQRIARSHHERWDGSGYPDRVAGDAIPLEGRIVAVVDVFDALTHDRPYKIAWPLEEALAEIERQGERQFDPDVVRAFLTLTHETL